MAPLLNGRPTAPCGEPAAAVMSTVTELPVFCCTVHATPELPNGLHEVPGWADDPEMLNVTLTVPVRRYIFVEWTRISVTLSGQSGYFWRNAKLAVSGSVETRFTASTPNVEPR